jgi:hypothetical protein
VSSTENFSPTWSNIVVWIFVIGVGLVLICFGRAAANTAITEGLGRALGALAAIAFLWFILWVLAQ